MKKVRYYILTSGKFKALKRHIDPDYSDIPIDDLVIVINTKCKQYERKASEWCVKNGIEYHVTESDGTPGTGKNSLFDVFLASDDDYMVQIDGDDFLTPHGVWLYKHLATTESPPDAVCLLYQISLCYNWTEVDRIETYKKSIHNDPLYRPNKAEWPISKAMPFRSIDPGLRERTSIVDYLIDSKKNNKNLWRAKRFNKYNQEFHRLNEKYVDALESHCRVVWLSRKAVEANRFCGLQVGEDTIFYYKLKHLGLTGKLDVRTNVEYPTTYVYDETLDGVVSEASGFGTDYNWMYAFNREVKKLEKQGILHAYTNLPELKIDYPVDYKPNHLGLSKEYEFPYNAYGLKGTIMAPANASEETLINRYNNLKISDI